MKSPILLAVAVLSLTIYGSPLFEEPQTAAALSPRTSAGSDIDQVLNIDKVEHDSIALGLNTYFSRQDAEEFDVTKSTGATYKNFVEKLRRRVQDPGITSHGRPVLTLQDRVPSRWFDLVLRSGSQAVRLRIRSDNLYLDGYRAENSDQWFEFENDDRDLHLIPGSTHLSFDGGYNSLQNAAGRRRDETYLGQQSLASAISQLVDSTDRAKRAHALLVIIQMVCESIRFTHISDMIAQNYATRFVPDGRMIALENGWGDLSAALLHHDQDPEGPIRLHRPNPMNIDSITAAALVIGILLRRNIEPSSRSRREVEALIPEGRPLAEILRLKVKNIDDEDPGELYGTITSTDGLGSQDIYNVVSDNYQEVGPNQEIKLPGPFRAISAAGSFTIDFSLMDDDAGLPVWNPNDEISKGQISWNVYSPTNVYDEVLVRMISGKYGEVEVDYIVRSNAAEAQIEVVLLNGDDEDPAEVFGKMAAFGEFLDTQVTLFAKKSNEYIEIRPGESIPLSRSVLTVPMGQDLGVLLNLWESDDGYSPVDEIAVALPDTYNAIFLTPQVSHSTKQTVQGKYGEVEIRVTWS